MDGIRPVGGYLIEAKHARDPNCAKHSFRSIERVETLAKPVKVDANSTSKWDPLIDGMYRSDESELRHCKSAMANPANSEIRSLETNTSDLRDAPVLDFESEVASCVFVTGAAAMLAPDYAHISLIDVTAHTAALFAQ
ncbi:restriction endonuclease fold toxin-2 domain-containing protein [Streptomyces sp. NPDC002265]|uniref:restriction endonuclease fold toxin-2 domain-containing protein n=1 Tax=Streptomyces sp. NPDC002265 TaxID=3154415 RepID=UPI00333237E3